MTCGRVARNLSAAFFHVAFMKRFLVAAAVLPIAYAFVEPHRIVVRRFDVKVPNLPPEAEGLKVAQLSDLHCSIVTSRKIIWRAVELCNAEKPHIVALTGDYISRPDSYLCEPLLKHLAKTPSKYARQCVEELSQLRARDGIFAVRGNHDFAAGGFEVVDNLLRQCGIEVLVNSSTRCRGLAIIGLDDLRQGDVDVRAATQNVSREEAQLILSHNPRMLLSLHDRNALILSGHTHGGQVHLPLSSFRRRPCDMRGSEFHDGWYRENDAQMYVSVGVGSVHFPLRFNCPPEICIFTLRSEPRINTEEDKVKNRVLDTALTS
jgi:predicted MPP superfamily phosphohydrolase